MHEAHTRLWRLVRAAVAAIVAFGLLAGAAEAATTTYPSGGSSFDGDADGWTGSDASCAMTSGVSLSCSASTTYDASGRSLATDVDVTVNLLGLFSGSAVWTSPAFTIPADANVTGASLAFDAAFAAGGLVNLGLTSQIDVRLVDETDAGTTPAATVMLDDRDATLAPQGGALPAGAIEAGHTYRLVFRTTTSSSLSSIGLLGSARTSVDDVMLDVTSADPPAAGGNPSGGGIGGGSGGSGAAAGSTTGGAVSGDGAGATSGAGGTRAAAVRRGGCTIVGTPRADRLVGTRGRDVICGLGGNDVLIGHGGSDTLIGGRGRDALLGGAGEDVLRGGPGADVLRGGAARDALLGGPGRDLLVGGPGGDVLRGGGGRDRLLGGPGRDLARGTLRRDRLVGVERRRR
jgi:Ca2+-binding RTX toxin-like protein